MQGHSTQGGTPSANPEPEPPADASSNNSSLRYSIEEITSEEGLSSLEPDWNRLSETAEHPNVFMTFDWFRAWNHHFTQQERGKRRPHVLVLKNGGGIVGILPLIFRRASRFGVAVRKLEFVETLADYHDFALGNDPAGQIGAIAHFLAATRDQWDVVELRDLRETGYTRALIGGALAQVGLHYRVLTEKERCPYLPIAGDSATQLEKLSGHVRRTLHKRMERAQALGMRVRIIENPQDEHGLLEKMIALEAQKRSDGKPTEPFIGEYRKVFQSLLDTLGPRHWVYVALMELEGRPVAWQFGFRCGKRLWDYNKAFDHTFSRYAPGTLLVAALLDYGFSHGYEEYDFLRGEEPYKTVWSTRFHERFRLQIWSDRLIARTRAFVYLDFKTAVYRLLGKGD
jgi:CelD/BcsL family acetyltransferase involved in cellulose biosynthesis